MVKNILRAISREAKAIELGEGRYYNVIIWSAIILQFYFLGTIGVIYSASSLVSGILISVLLPVTEILAVFIYGEKLVQKKEFLLPSLYGDLFHIFMVILKKARRKKNNLRKQIWLIVKLVLRDRREWLLSRLLQVYTPCLYQTSVLYHD